MKIKNPEAEDMVKYPLLPDFLFSAFQLTHPDT